MHFQSDTDLKAGVGMWVDALVTQLQNIIVPHEWVRSHQLQYHIGIFTKVKNMLIIRQII